MFWIDDKVKSQCVGQLEGYKKEYDVTEQEKEETFGKAGF